ncbi:DMT family transporter [Pararhodobacter sp. SW119]|uniref:DMT family transporter n=1 Tax=Pararhodobacter sp. SW119 TaxID=2780075 RepID=UPI001AE06125|nr:DMT family transporter [Pararhodobacter sp. SW119]
MNRFRGLSTGEPGAALAIVLAVMAAALNALDAVLVRLVSETMHPFAIGFFRSAFGLLFVAPWMVSLPRLARSSYRWTHVVRAGIKLGALVAFYAAFARANLADATAIMFTAPLFLTLGAWMVLRERLDLLRIIAILAGFCGALIIIRPGQGDPSPALLFALGGAALIAVSQLMLKVMSRRDDTRTLVAWNLVVTVPLAVLPALYFWATPSWDILALLALQGGLGALNMAMLTRAFSLTEASRLAPIDFLRLPVVALLAFVAFGEVAGINTWIGAAVILGGTLLLTVGGVRLRWLTGMWR